MPSRRWFGRTQCTLPNLSTMIQDVTSPANPAIKLLKSLHAKKNRLESGLFLAEGARLAQEAAQMGIWPEILAVSAAATEREAVARLINEALRNGTRVLRTSEAVLQAIAKRDNAQTVIGAYRQRLTPLDALTPARRWVALEAIRDPGNLGTIVRTADAAGAGGVILLEGGCDAFSTECVRASMGSIFSLAITRASFVEFEAWRRGHGLALIGTSLEASQRLETLAPQPPFVLLMGNEQAGLPPAMARACDALIRLPMAGKADSLNLAVATGIALYGLWSMHSYDGATR